MNHSATLCFATALFALTSGGAFADDTHHVSDGAAKGQANEGVAPDTGNCTKDQVWNSQTKTCDPAQSINYNSSKSNTGNVTGPPPKNTDSSSPQ